MEKNQKQKNIYRGLLDSPVVKNPPANARDIGWITGPGGFHMPWSN